MRGTGNPSGFVDLADVSEQFFGIENAGVPDGSARTQRPQQCKEQSVDVLLRHGREDHRVFGEFFFLAVTARIDALDFTEKLA